MGLLSEFKIVNHSIPITYKTIDIIFVPKSDIIFSRGAAQAIKNVVTIARAVDK